MAIMFKGIDLESNLARIIPHMATAEEYGGVLQHLQSVWDNLSLLEPRTSSKARSTTCTRPS
jgi:hypothetical protein